MFFFSRVIQKNRTDRNIKKIINYTLQVRIPLIKKIICGKRTFSSASPGQDGSLTVEAAFVLPLFFFAMVTLLMPFSMMNRQRQVQAVVESVCEDLSRLAYVGYELKEKKTEIKLPADGLEIKIPMEGLEAGAMMAYAQIQIRRKLDEAQVRQLSLARSQFLEDGETIYLDVSYQLMFPFPILRLSGIIMTSSSRRRAWIGKDGGWLEADDGEKGEDEIVYVGKTSTRYHESRTCHYLCNQLTGIVRGEIDSQRNADGKRYYPCAACGGGTGDKVYIMPSGTSYHGSASCSAIIAYVRAVKKSEVEYMGACFYCSGG